MTHWGNCASRNGGACDCAYPADPAGVSARERLAALIAAEAGWDWPEVAAEGIPSALSIAADVADAILAAGFGDVAQSKAEALEEASSWADGIADGMAVGSYAHGPSGREADLSMKYQHAAGWLSARAESLRTPSANGGGE